MEIRTLDAAEREAFLVLVDGWDVGDGWRGADFFRRYLEDDPSFEDRNLHVAVEGGSVVSCVQVFPRSVNVRGHAVPLGGIGSVYTHPDHRRRGLAETLLARASEQMAERGMELSLLFTGRFAWYAKLGWTQRPIPRLLLRGPASASAAGDAFAPERDLAAVRALHGALASRLDGCALRDDALWQASLRNAGNPDESFRVSRAGGRVLAYVRTTRLQGFENLIEIGRSEDGLEPLADLLADRVGDLLVAPALGFDPPLLPALEARGIQATATEDPTPMWRCLDPEALASRIGEAPRPGEAPADWLGRLLPPERTVFWMADRF